MPLYGENQGEMDPHKDNRGQTELPTWLESLRVNERTNSPASDQSQFSMSDLIDEGALPGWMRQEDGEMIEKGNSGKYLAWRPASMPAPNTDEGNIPPEGLAARSLIDEQALPSWVQSTTGQVPVTPDSQKNFSAASLIQPDYLPDWMKSTPQTPTSLNNVWGDVQSPAYPIHGNMPNPAYDNAPLPPQSFRNEPSGVDASSLFDANSMPAWLREEDQMQPYSAGQSGPAPTGNRGLAGSSLIDANAVPDWLRSFDHQQQANVQSMGNIRPYGTAPRIDNARVPSRPRAENVPQEQSEVAANVFSSVLGVASSAPYFPSGDPGSQRQTPGQGAMAPSQGFQGGQPQSPTGMPWNAPAQSPGFTDNPQMQGYNPAVYQGGQQVLNYMGTNVSYPGMPQQQLPSTPGMPMGTSMAQQPNSNASNTKPAKRGFLDTIRSWFK
jgi:hypothetical protein